MLLKWQILFDNMEVEIEREKEHNEIVEEVMKRLAENDLYIWNQKNISKRLEKWNF